MTPELASEIARLYANDMSGPSVAAQLQIPTHWVYRALRRAGIPRRDRRVSPPVFSAREKVRRLRKSGLTFQAIGDSLGMTRQRAHQLMRDSR